jgi:hypothetical protein
MVLAILSYDSAPQNPSYSVDKCLRAIDRSEGGAFTPEAPPMQRVASKMALRQTPVFPSAEEFLNSDYLDKTKCLILDIAMPGMIGPELQDELTRAK